MTATNLPASAGITSTPAKATLPVPSTLGALSPTSIDHTWRIATGFSKTKLVPAHFQGHPEDCMIAIDLAERLNCPPLMVMQNIYVVGGRPGFSVEFLTALTILRGSFSTPITYSTSGTLNDGTLAVTAKTRLANGAEVSATVTLAEARADGWDRNPKYKSMPEHMLTKRAAGRLISLYAPDVKLGMPTIEEAQDDAITAWNEPVRPEPQRPAQRGALPVMDAETVAADLGDTIAAAEDVVEAKPVEQTAVEPTKQADPTPTRVVVRHADGKPYKDYDRAGVACQKGLQELIEAATTLDDIDAIAKANTDLVKIMAPGSQANVRDTANAVRARLSQAAAAPEVGGSGLEIPVDPVRGCPDWQRYVDDIVGAAYECRDKAELNAMLESNRAGIAQMTEAGQDWKLMLDDELAAIGLA